MSGVTAGTIALAAATTIGGAMLSKMMAPKMDKPGVPEMPTLADPTQVDKVAKDAQKRSRQAAAAAVGRADTILTGPMGLGSAESTGNTAVKTILGG